MLKLVFIIESSPYALAPPRPIEGEFWSNGFLRYRDVLNMDIFFVLITIIDTVNPEYKKMYDERKFIENGEAKAEAAYS